MEEKHPWWRWALAFALGGIRSGFGLVRRNGKGEVSPETSAEAFVAEPVSSFEPGNGPEHENERVELSAESSPEPENKESEVESIDERPAETETSEVESSTEEPAEAEFENVESSAVAGAADEVAEPEIALREPEVPAELEAPEEEIALTKTSPQSEQTPDDVAQAESVSSPEETTAANVAAPAADPQLAEERTPAAEAELAPEPVTASVPSPAPPPDPPPAARATPPQDPAPTLPFDPPPAAKPAPEPTTAEKVAAALKARGVDAEQSPFSVFVGQVYDGPLDLLLDLIRKQDIDIYDIPIAKITAQFLAYVDHLRASDMDVAGEFIYTAALLIHIKSKMLLPRAPVGPEESAEDPRRELVDRLLEHERFRNAAQMLHEKQMLEAASWTNPGVREFREDAGAEPEIAADTTDLVRIFRDILERARNRPILDVEEDSVTVGQMIQFLTRRLTMEDKPVALRRLLSHTHSERALIAMFLALLELVRLQAILLRQDRQFSEIFVKKNTGFDAVMNEGLASARDDWR